MGKGIAQAATFNPTEWQTVGYFYTGPNDEMSMSYDLDETELFDALRNAGVYESVRPRVEASKCESCGTSFWHGAVVQHVAVDDSTDPFTDDASETFLVVGQICAFNHFGTESIVVQKRKDAERHKITLQADEFIVEHDLQHIVEHIWTGKPVDHPKDGAFFEGWGGGTAYDIISKLRRYGSLSEKQVELLGKIHREHHERQARRSEEDAIEKTPVVEGRIEIEGTVLGTKWQESMYGDTLKMLVAVDTEQGRYKVWGTVPASLDASWDDDGEFSPEVQKGDEIRFVGTFERSADDEAFGFFKHPSKAVFVSRSTVDTKEGS